MGLVKKRKKQLLCSVFLHDQPLLIFNVIDAIVVAYV